MKTKLAYALAMSLALASVSFAGDNKEESGSPVSVGVDLTAGYSHEKLGGDLGDWWGNPTWEDTYTGDLHVNVTAQLADKIRARVRLELTELYDNYGPEVTDTLSRAIEEAVIEIRQINGTPVAAVIFGKQKVAFGFETEDLPGFKDSLLYELGHKDEVIGVTVALSDLLGFAIKASVFENGEGDMKIAEEYGVAVEISRQLSNNIRLKASGLWAETSWTEDKRATVGLVYDSGDGRFSASLEGMYFEGFASDFISAYLGYDSNYAVKASASLAVGPGTVRVSVAYLEQVAYELAAAYDLPVADGLTLTPAIRYLSEENGYLDVTRAMLEARVRLGNNPEAVR